MLRKRNALTIVEVIVVIGVLLLLAALMLPAVRSAREPARRNSCLNNLKQNGLAQHNYHDKHGHFPPTYTVDEEGKLLHSWRTLLLPDVEFANLYDTIDLTRSWDDSANTKARQSPVYSYECPSTNMEAGYTIYQAPVGVDWAFAGATSRILGDFIDGPSKTILNVEVDPKRAVHFMAPEDHMAENGMPFDKDTQGAHPNVNLAVFADGHTMTIQRDIDPEVLRGMLTIAGGEEPADY